MNTSNETIGITEQVLLFVTNSKAEVTCLDVAKGMNIESGTNLILQTLAKKGLINERIERNGTRRYSVIEPSFSKNMIATYSGKDLSEYANAVNNGSTSNIRYYVNGNRVSVGYCYETDMQAKDQIECLEWFCGSSLISIY